MILIGNKCDLEPRVEPTKIEVGVNKWQVARV